MPHHSHWVTRRARDWLAHNVDGGPNNQLPFIQEGHRVLSVERCCLCGELLGKKTWPKHGGNLLWWIWSHPLG